MPVFMLFKTNGDAISVYVGSYNDYSSANEAMTYLSKKKSAGEDYYILQGYRYG